MDDSSFWWEPLFKDSAALERKPVSKSEEFFGPVRGWLEGE